MTRARLPIFVQQNLPVAQHIADASREKNALRSFVVLVIDAREPGNRALATQLLAPTGEKMLDIVGSAVTRTFAANAMRKRGLRGELPASLVRNEFLAIFFHESTCRVYAVDHQHAPKCVFEKPKN